MFTHMQKVRRIVCMVLAGMLILSVLASGLALFL